jgi:hypothetical protein
MTAINKTRGNRILFPSPIPPSLAIGDEELAEEIVTVYLDDIR